MRKLFVGLVLALMSMGSAYAGDCHRVQQVHGFAQAAVVVPHSYFAQQLVVPQAYVQYAPQAIVVPQAFVVDQYAQVHVGQRVIARERLGLFQRLADLRADRFARIQAFRADRFARFQDFRALRVERFQALRDLRLQRLQALRLGH